MPCCQFRSTSPTLCRGIGWVLGIDPLHDGVSTSMVAAVACDMLFRRGSIQSTQQLVAPLAAYRPNHGETAR